MWHYSLILSHVSSFGKFWNSNLMPHSRLYMSRLKVGWNKIFPNMFLILRDSLKEATILNLRMFGKFFHSMFCWTSNFLCFNFEDNCKIVLFLFNTSSPTVLHCFTLFCITRRSGRDGRQSLTVTQIECRYLQAHQIWYG